MKKKISMFLALALCLSLALVGCTPKEPTPTDTPLPTESVSPSSDPVEIVTPNPDEGSEFPGVTELTYNYPALDISLTLPDSWSGYYKTVETEGEYPVVKFVYADTDAEALGDKVNLAELKVVETSKLVAEYGEDYLTAMQSETTEVVEQTYAEYSVLLTRYIHDITDADGHIWKMYTELADPNLYYLYVPEYYAVPEVAQPLVDAITAARDTEENDVFPVIADPAHTEWLELFTVDPATVETFAVSGSMMNVKAYGIAIIKPVAGQEEAVRAALNAYKDLQIQNYTQYLPDQLAIAEDAVIETVNGYEVCVMCENASDVFASIKNSIGK